MFTFTENEDLKREIKIFQAINNTPSVTEICRKMEIFPQAYYNIFKKKKIAFLDIKHICDAMDAELCIEIRKKPDAEKDAKKKAIEAQIADLQVKLKKLW